MPRQHIVRLVSEQVRKLALLHAISENHESPRIGLAAVRFFAPAAAGVMIHYGTSVHAHAILSMHGKTIAGHVDRVSVTRGMTLRVPVAD